MRSGCYRGMVVSILCFSIVNCMYKIVAPYNICLPRKTMEDKCYPVNLNAYRNWKPIVNNLLKKKYKEYLLEQVNLLPHFNNVWIIYKPYYWRGWKHDKLNVWAVTSKFFLDVLVETETIDDDNDSIVDVELFLPWEVNKDNPHVEILLFDNKREFKEYIKKHL